MSDSEVTDRALGLVFIELSDRLLGGKTVTECQGSHAPHLGLNLVEGPRRSFFTHLLVLEVLLVLPLLAIRLGGLQLVNLSLILRGVNLF